jgi:hypothetical protein
MGLKSMCDVNVKWIFRISLGSRMRGHGVYIRGRESINIVAREPTRGRREMRSDLGARELYHRLAPVYRYLDPTYCNLLTLGDEPRSQKQKYGRQLTYLFCIHKVGTGTMSVKVHPGSTVIFIIREDGRGGWESRQFVIMALNKLLCTFACRKRR